MAIGRKPATKRRSRIFICCGVSSCIDISKGVAGAGVAQPEPSHSLSMAPCLRCRRIRRFRGRAFQLGQDFTKGRDQLIARNVALLELNPELEGIVLRLKVEDERPRALRSRLLFAAFAARLVARQ